MKYTRSAIPRRSTAASPIAIPAIAPVDNEEEEVDECVGMGDVTEVGIVEIVGNNPMEELVDEDEAGPAVDVLDTVPFTAPFGPRSSYAVGRFYYERNFW